VPDKALLAAGLITGLIALAVVMFIIFRRVKRRNTLPADEADAVTMEAHCPEVEQGRLITAGGTHPGTRSSQQDALYVTESSAFTPEVVLGVVCDGMGGLEGGEVASQMAVDLFVADLMQLRDFASAPEALEKAARMIDEAVCRMAEQAGGIAMGTTLVAALAWRNQLHWVSAGDSRIYVLRGDEILQLTRDHNYLLQLNEMVRSGAMTEAEAEADSRAEALISFIGMGGIGLLDINEKPFLLRNGDVVLLCSDGLYKAAADAEILACVREHFYDLKKAADALIELACGSGDRPPEAGSRDNTSVVLIQYTE